MFTQDMHHGCVVFDVW